MIMKKTATYIALLMISLSAFSQKTNVIVDIAPVERFYELMAHIEKQNGSKLRAKYGNVEQLQAAYDKNIKDTMRQQLIESLLETRPYSHQYMDYVRTWRRKGQDAYRIAFNMIGEYCPRMTAGMPVSWVRYWNRKKLDLELIRKTTNAFKVKDSLVFSYLPKTDLNPNVSAVIYYAVDGNRGGYTDGDAIVMDLINSPMKNSEEVENTIAHELFHIYYFDWLDRKITTAPVDSALRDFQLSFVNEGIAQYLTYPDYPEVIKKLYRNKKLLKELMTDLEAGRYDGNKYKLQRSRLWKYAPFAALGNYEYRPTLTYYLSLNIYQSIEKVGGREMLDYVIANPKELINTYNKLYDKNVMQFDPFSQEFAKKWSDNL